MNLFDKITGIHSRIIPGKSYTDNFGSASSFLGTAPTQSVIPTAYKPTQAPIIRPEVQSPTVQKQQKQIGILFADEKKAYEAMKADGIPDNEAINIIGERRKNIRDTVGIPQIASKEEAKALEKMQADGLDSITSAGLIKQYRSQFKDTETQKFEEAYKGGNLLQKGAYNTLALGAGNLETIAKYSGNLLDYATLGKAGFGEDVKAMESVTQSPEFQTSSAFKTGTYLPDVAIGVSPIGGGYLAGAKSGLGLAGRSGVVGAGFGATQPILEKGSEATMGDIATGGAIGGVAGAVLSPVIGLAGKGIIKGAEKVGKYGTALRKGGIEGVQKSVARDISGFRTPGSETLTRNIPKAVVRRDLGFTPTERAKIEKITGQDEGTYVLSKGLAGKGKEELAEVFMKQSDDMYNGITRDLSKVNTKIQSPVAKEALLDIMEQLESSPKIARAYAKDIEGVKSMLARNEFTLSELNNIRRAYDKVNTGMFTVQGKARSGLENAIDVKVRQDLSNQLQKEARKYGVDVKAMNTELRAGLEMKDALLRRLSQEERNNFIGLQDLGVSAILSGGEPVSAVATIVAKKYAEKVAPGLSQKLYNLNKTPNVTRNVSRGNTITNRNKSSQLGLASNSSTPMVSNVVKSTPKKVATKFTPKEQNDIKLAEKGPMSIPLEVSNPALAKKVASKEVTPKKITTTEKVEPQKVETNITRNEAIEKGFSDSAKARWDKGEFTIKERGNAVTYLKSNYKGKEYTIDGKTYKVKSIDNRNEQVSLEDSNGNILRVKTNKLPETKVTNSDISNYYNGRVQKGYKTIKDPTKTTVNLTKSKGGFIKIPEIGKKYSPEGAIRTYTNSSDKINKMLREGKSYPQIEALDSFLKSSKKYDGTVYRGMTIDEGKYQSILDDIRKNGIKDKAFLSTTENYGDATTYSRNSKVDGKKGIMLEIESKNGSIIDKKYNAYNEEEILFPRNTEFEYVGEYNDAGRGLIIKLKEKSKSIPVKNPLKKPEAIRK